MLDNKTVFPRYNLSRILQLRDRLSNDDLTEFCGYTATGEHFEQFVDKLCSVLTRVPRQTMFDSVRDVAGTLVLADDIFRISWRLAGNLALLRTGVPVPAWHFQSEKEWMPAQVMRWRDRAPGPGKPGGTFTLQILAGTACPMCVTRFWTNRFCHYIGRRAGYTSRRHSQPMGHVSELVNMRLWVQIDPQRCQVGTPGFTEVGCTSGLLKWNKGIINKRFRKGYRCPQGYTHLCFRCPVGYRDCPAATHANTVTPTGEGNE